ncbi:hypothetical protein Fifi44_00064 [Erwinia phage Fifi44]|uniref:Uncharacterized protein n=1 Tax=Erwinia phage Fifi44 TaxID=2876597 RepID=A0AAE8Y4F3_9CAUD|nr:hypothetical protein QNG95_gp64 [Erwinia phage Fifi44]UCR74933.1 hypothetical protein Fifi44_00064 [Erwinia phage Fifi44]UCR80834.1 hypothetical protein Fifi451_00014 [Erwinia phage Fifi451]
MASRKEMMGMGVDVLRALGLEAGLNFEPGLSKSKMVLQLEQHQASGWMDVNSQLLHASAEGGFDHMQGFTGYEEESISDAARVAQSLAGAGYTETFHHIMSGGKSHHVEAVHGYMAKLGVSADDVWLHMPKPNPELPAQDFNLLKGYLNNHWDDYQDIMPPLAGHYAGDIMGEYATNKGHVGDSYNHLSSMYLNKAAYNNPHAYEKDAALVATRLASAMGGQFLEVGYAAATGAKVGYHSILPQLGSDIVRGVQHPREALNAAGLPLGSMGSAVGSGRGDYSLVASLLGRAEGQDEASKAIRSEVSSTLKSLAGSYKGGGEFGMNPHRHETSEHDLLLDSATRYVGIEDARSGYANLDDTSYNRNNIAAIIENNYDRMDAQAAQAPSGVANPDLRMPRRSEIGTAWSADLNEPTDWNAARVRRESAAIANLDAAHANFRDVADGGPSGSTVRFHNFQQGSQEWHDFRSQYDITGSTVGSMLGSNSYTRPWAEMIDRIGLQRGDGSKNAFTERMFAMGHKREDEARIRVSERLGQEIQQVGSITNDQYPGMMYSPDGLIGDDALWEHKAPERAGKFADLLAGDHPDYMDQIQMGMLVSGRNRTLFSQTIGSETRDQWIDQDPSWYGRNKTRLDSIRGRLAAGREFVASNPDLDQEALIKGARSVMQGEGIWRDVSQRSNRGFSATAGTDADPFIGRGGSTYNDAAQPSSNYIPNFVTSAGNGLVPVGGNGAETGMALAVKEGILGAQEELKQRHAQAGAASGGVAGLLGSDMPDADFADSTGSGGIRGFFQRMFGGGSGGAGGNGGGSGGASGWMDDFGGSLYGGLRSGNLRGLQNGTLDAIESLPMVGGILRGTIGAMQAGGEGIATMSNYRGIAEDSGMTSGVAFAAQTQGLEMMGLNANQAGAINQTIHSVYNRMQNGDPDAAVQIAVQTRGLITPADLQSSGGDATKIAALIRQRGEERGWSQSRIAGAMEMAGLDGMARVATRSEATMDQSRRLVDARSAEDVSGANSNWENAQRNRALASTDYSVPRYSFESLGGAGESLSGSMVQAAAGAERAFRAGGDMIDLVRNLESGGQDFDAHGNPVTSSSGAKYSMQVLPSTARDPGYGIRPAANDSPEEYNRVGREKLDAMMKRYGGDWRKANAAYTDGEGTVDSAIKQYGNDWLSHMPSQAQKRVRDMERAGFNGGNANSFRDAGSNGQQNLNVTVNINATVNDKSTRASVTNPYSGEVVTINSNHGSVAQRR